MTRIAVIEKDKCHPLRCGNYLCIRLCPVNRAGKECIVKGEDSKARIITELCTGCGICPKRCPFGAIHIINLPEMLKDSPIHRYGENGFHLFNLPSPVFGKVVGILGRNGIGKSTAIKILAGVLKPNLGKNDHEADLKELITRFKGTESQVFFEKLKSGAITVSYKPQAVELIPKHAKGTVEKLLRKADERGKFSQIVEALELQNILDHDITVVSGGELQRVAIAVSALKKANLYIFDEPTSYLDIKQRIKAANFIRSLADDNTTVLVVEHDLIILDLMADMLHIMYGEQGAYGVVSQIKAARAGINSYLEGFLREENMRFRPDAIRFVPKSSIRKRGETVLNQWNNVRKKLGNFWLETGIGEIKLERTCGIVGENGIGKTTFVKILAGVIAQDSGTVAKSIKVSYKPQYLESESDKLVSELLRDAVSKYGVSIINPLGVDELMLKRLNELSGGELQKVSIALCLSKEADLYLLDEPSAFLDVEQRLTVSKVIRDLMEQRSTSAFVVDHDLLFIDYLSDDLIVFEGKPAEHGSVTGPFAVPEGMNRFLTGLDITMRRDEESHRPRINKPDSQMDRKQKAENKRYY